MLKVVIKEIKVELIYQLGENVESRRFWCVWEKLEFKK